MADQSSPKSLPTSTSKEDAPTMSKEAATSISKDETTSSKETAPKTASSSKETAPVKESLLHNFRHATLANPEREKMPTTLMGRPKFNKSGKPATINVNSHRIEAYPTKTVYQYDVSLQPL